MLYENNMQQVWRSVKMLRLSPDCLAPTRATTNAFHLTCPPGRLAPTRATTSAFYLTCPPYTMVPMVLFLISAPVHVVSAAC